jgi:hypothetical protein
MSEAVNPDSVGLTALPPIAENSNRLLARPWAVSGVDSMMTVRPANVVMLLPSPTSTRAPTNQLKPELPTSPRESRFLMA